MVVHRLKRLEEYQRPRASVWTKVWICIFWLVVFGGLAAIVWRRC